MKYQFEIKRIVKCNDCPIIFKPRYDFKCKMKEKILLTDYDKFVEKPEWCPLKEIQDDK